MSDEASVQPVWQRLAERATALGQPAPKVDTTTDPELYIVAKGSEPAAAVWQERAVYLPPPKGATEVCVVSRVGSPTDVRPWLEDRRCLGVYVERIVLRDASNVQEAPLGPSGSVAGLVGGGEGLHSAN